MAQPVWNTPTGSLGTIPSLNAVTIVLSADARFPAIAVTYSKISGSLPSGLVLSPNGVIYGTPTIVSDNISSAFVIRATDNNQNISDRTFSITVTGTAVPKITTLQGNLLHTNDSIWVELPIEYSNPINSNEVLLTIAAGSLPAGLEFKGGVIRGYPSPPVVNVNVSVVTTAVTSIHDNGHISCFSTSGFYVGRPIIFSSTSMIGGIVKNQPYYVKEIINSTTFTISYTQFGPLLTLAAGSGYMTATLPSTSVGQPTIRTYSFTVRLESALGTDIAAYTITVVNQNTPINKGGPGYPPNTRKPVILNTRPQTFNISDTDPYYGYYIVPNSLTISPSIPANMGTFQSDDLLAFKIIGHDFDDNSLVYNFFNLPMGFTGNHSTGWITGTPVLSSNGLHQYTFYVSVCKQANPSISSAYFYFSFIVARGMTSVVTWITDSNLGTLSNCTLSTRGVQAIADTELEYRLIGGSLPPNLTLLSSGEIAGYVAMQPTESVLNIGDTTEFTFTIQAFSPHHSLIRSNKTFTITVYQEYDQPIETLYVRATPNLEDRAILKQLLSNDDIIPPVMIYRPSDINFGKATGVLYEHMYGVYASDITQYLEATEKNHYWRNITLGEIKTAIAKDSNGEVLYEVVYSQIIDDLQINDTSFAVAESNEYVIWDHPINLQLGPWYTSITDIFTSFEEVSGNVYYTSLTPGYARVLYPNSLYQMRARIASTLGQEHSSNLLPLWMTSQQRNGSTLGYIQAWVICYTKPGYAEIVKNNINSLWVDKRSRPYLLNMINFKIDRVVVNKSNTYNFDNTLDPPAWSSLPSSSPMPNPIDCKDFYVLFPRKTILPDTSQ